MDNMKKNYFFIAIIIAFFSNAAMAQAVVTTFNTPGANTYTVEAGNTVIVVIEAWGGGAGGGSGSNAKGGGGGGAYSRTTTSLTEGNYSVTVGAGGGAGVNGTTSSFTSLVAAVGGTSTTTITGGAGGLATAGTGSIKWNGGAGGNGGSAAGPDGGGGGGGSALAGGAGNAGANGTSNPTNTGGAGGTGSGVGGRGGDASAPNDATLGAAPGAGGGGQGDFGTSKAGANGRVVVTVSSGGPLPIKVFYFNAAKAIGGNTLNWSATCSSTSATFEIERSADGKNFTSINSLTATQERCSQPFTYSDNTTLPGNAFYRIKIIDTEGKINYTSIVKLGGHQKDMHLTALLPNPVSNTAQLSITTSKKDNVQLAIVSLDGKVVYNNTVQLQTGTSIVGIDVSGLTKGAYIIKGVFGDGQTNAIKFVKQ